jgi:hypothetical protein
MPYPTRFSKISAVRKEKKWDPKKMASLSEPKINA